MNLDNYEKSLVEYKGEKIIIVFDYTNKIHTHFNYNTDYPEIKIMDILSYENYPKSILKTYTYYELVDLYDADFFFTIINNKIEKNEFTSRLHR